MSVQELIEAFDGFASLVAPTVGADASCWFGVGPPGDRDPRGLGVLIEAGRPTLQRCADASPSFRLVAEAPVVAAFLAGRAPLAPLLRHGNASGDLVAIALVTGTFESSAWRDLVGGLAVDEIADEITRSVSRRAP